MKSKPLTNLDLQAIRFRLDAATAGPLRLGIYDPDLDPVEIFRKSLSYGSGPVWAVSAPEHKDAIGGWDERPKCAVSVCTTGNGPTGWANAEMIVHAPDDLRSLLGEVKRLRSENTHLTIRFWLAACVCIGTADVLASWLGSWLFS